MLTWQYFKRQKIHNRKMPNSATLKVSNQNLLKGRCLNRQIGKANLKVCVQDQLAVRLLKVLSSVCLTWRPTKEVHPRPSADGSQFSGATHMSDFRLSGILRVNPGKDCQAVTSRVSWRGL